MRSSATCRRALPAELKPKTSAKAAAQSRWPPHLVYASSFGVAQSGKAPQGDRSRSNASAHSLARVKVKGDLGDHFATSDAGASRHDLV